MTTMDMLKVMHYYKLLLPWSRLLLRQKDIIARVGGDKFAVAIGALNDLVYVEKIAKRIILEINKDTLLNYADKAMYSVKKSSKNDFMIYSESV